MPRKPRKPDPRQLLLEQVVERLEAELGRPLTKAEIGMARKALKDWKPE